MKNKKKMLIEESFSEESHKIQKTRYGFEECVLEY